MRNSLIVVLILAVSIALGAILQRTAGRPIAAKQHTAAAPTSRPAAKQLWTCSMHPQVIQDHPGTCPICRMELTPVKQTGSGANGAVEIDPTVVQNMGVRTAVVTEGVLQQTIRVAGYVQEQEPLHRDINLRVNGWIEKLYANVDGMMVEKGQKLFDLYSPELAVAVDELIAVRRQAGASAGDTSAQSFLESSRRKLQQFGLTPEQIEELSKLEKAPLTISILSPMNGHVTEKMVYEGASVKAGDLVLRLADRHAMWIDAQVYEQQYGAVNIGANATVRVVAEPGRVYEGQVIFIHPHLDPATRTALARIEVDNTDHLLRQGMYASVEITNSGTKPMKLIPRESVIDTGRRQVAFVSLGQGKFEPRKLKLGAAGQDSVQVLDGLEIGDTVVTSGQFLLDSESRLREAISKRQADLAMPMAAPATEPANPQAKIKVPHTDEIVSAYLEIQKQLGAIQKNDQPVEIAPLLDSAAMATMHAEGDAKTLAAAVAKSAEAMKGKPLPEQREAFVGVSQATLALVRASPPSSKVAKTLFVIHCPMAFHDKGADWIQATEEVANPYYAKQMKACGSIEQRISSAE
ncbi:MAG: efflux RND transporter periplasmic adaptor subunit [Burkholderiales bacterium]|nr:efflux RND transporter periplasmic adaptor subunit [Phycisphaerae bacterium]